MSEQNTNDLLSITTDIVAAHVGNNRVNAEDVAGLITSVYAALADLGEKPAPVEETHEPAVTARKSLANDNHIISMIDGKPYTMLKRHLSQHGLTPAQYRERYNLSNDYPMTAVAYSARRRELARAIGLGRKKADDPAPVAAKAAPKAAKPAAPTGEKKARAPRKSAVEKFRDAKAAGPFADADKGGDSEG